MVQKKTGSIKALTSRFALSIFLSLLTFSMQAQTIDWVRTVESSGAEIGWSCAVSANGDSYFSGQFSGTASVGNQIITSQGAEDAFLVKYDRHGEVQWVQVAGGIYSDLGRDLLVDKEGNVYWSGTVGGQVTFLSTTIGNTGESSFFLAKISSDGQLQWVKAAGGPSAPFHSRMRPVSIDASGNILVAGTIDRPMAFDGQSIIPPVDGITLFTGVFSPNGICLSLIERATSEVPNYLNNTVGAAWGKNGRLYLSCTFKGTVNLNGGTVVSSAETQTFFVAYDSIGNTQWIKRTTGTEVGVGHLIVDIYERIWLYGIFTDTMTLEGQQLISAGSHDFFIAQFNRHGTMQWGKRYGGAGQEGHSSLMCSPSGKLYMVGDAAPYPFQHQPLTVLDTITLNGFSVFGNSGQDGLIACLDSLGQAEWAIAIGGLSSHDKCLEIAIDPHERLYVAGVIGPDATIGQQVLPGAGLGDAFLLRLTPPGVNVSAEELFQPAHLSVYPNPTSGIFRLRLPQQLNSPIQLQLFDSQGRVVHQEMITSNTAELFVQPANLSSGLYLLHLSNGKQAWQNRVVIER